MIDFFSPPILFSLPSLGIRAEFEKFNLVVSLGFFLILEREVEYEGSFDLFFSHFVFPLSYFFCIF